MLRKKSNLLFIFFLYLIIVLLFTKIDYRFVEEIPCCQDDHDYYSHAETIGIDFDLDYSNQFKGFEEERYFKNNIIAPRGFIGSGLLASPFLFVGSLFEKNLNSDSVIFNYKILFYSISAIFYFFLSIHLINISFKYLKIKTNLNYLFLLFMGSGIAYFAFERYSMTHVYEVFTTSLIIYVVIRFYTFESNRNYFAFLIPLVTLLSICVRWVNYHVLFIPLIIKILFRNRLIDKNTLLNNYLFYFSYLFFTGLLLILNKAIYGIYTINPATVYGNSNKLSSFLEMDPLSIFETIFISMFKILFSYEFGIFWFSPILFAGLIFLIYFVFVPKKENFFKYILLLLFYGIPFGMVILWQSTASSYGFRYLYSLIPIAILIYKKWSFEVDNSIPKQYLIYFSFFASLSIIFFETSPQTSLSQNINTFGIDDRFSQPNYLAGYLKSFFNIDAYLKIFTTSFLGVIFFKLVFAIFSFDTVNMLLAKLNLPVENTDYLTFVDNLKSVSNQQILIFLLLILLIVGWFILLIKRDNMKKLIS
tara:strand:+ start:306 stop:1904 length:1599 start_codon:yes stop_codon:yes gene_type:complete